jgi:hypothetical protein
VFRYFQRDARYLGFEALLSAELFEAGAFKVSADGVVLRRTPSSKSMLAAMPPSQRISSRRPAATSG